MCGHTTGKMEGRGKEGKTGIRFKRNTSRPERKPNPAKEDSAERQPERKPNRPKEESAERRPERKPNRAKEESAEKRTEQKANRAEPESAERRSVGPKPDKRRSNRELIVRDRSKKKLIRLNRRMNRSRPVKMRKRKPTETETDRSKPARMKADSIETDQPIPIRPNTNPIGRDRSGEKSRLIKTRKRPEEDTTADDKGQEYGEREQRIWWIGWQQWFGWKEWVYSKWRDKVGIAGKKEDITNEE